SKCRSTPSGLASVGRFGSDVFRFLPQQLISARLPYCFGVRRRAFARCALEQAGGARERKPDDRQVAAPPGDCEARGCRDPDAQAVEAVHELAEVSLPE